MSLQRTVPPHQPPAAGLPLWLAAVVFGLALALAVLNRPLPTDGQVTGDTPLAAQPLSAEARSESFPAGKNPAEITLTQFPDGRLAAAWTAETGDEDGERGVWFAVRGSTGWSPARLIANRSTTAAGTLTHAGMPGSPLLYAEGGWLHLWTISRDGISAGALNHTLSTDAGLSWRKPERVPMAPLAACALQTFAAPVALNDGGLLLPLRRDCLGPGIEWLRLSATGQVIGKQGQVADRTGTVFGMPPDSAPPPPPGQPSLGHIALPGNAWLLLGRPESTAERPRFWRHDGGQWQAQRAIDKLLPAFATGQPPALLRSRDGRIHLAVSDGVGSIHHLQLSEDWLAENEQ